MKIEIIVTSKSGNEVNLEEPEEMISKVMDAVSEYFDEDCEIEIKTENVFTDEE